jgi:DNA repair exonuclease SbcCD ATPase subunit
MGDIQQMRADLRALRTRVDLALERRSQVHEQREATAERLAAVQADAEYHAQAVPILMKIAQVYRKISLDKVNRLVTAALRGVFELPLEFRFKEEEKRGQNELTPVVVEDGDELDPVESMGGGIVDVISIAFRPTFYAMMREGKPDPIMVLDEPGFYVNSEKGVQNLARMFSQLSQELGLQLIIVTCRPLLTARADRNFEVVKKGRVSSAQLVADGTRHARND